MGRLIELDAAIAETWKDTGYSDPLNVMTAIRDRLEALPPVDAVPVRRGKWKHEKDLKQFFCDQCGEPSLTEDDVYFYGMEFPNFCPNCGADMRKDGEQHDTK